MTDPLTDRERAQCLAIARQRGDADEATRLLGTDTEPPAATSRYRGWPNAAGPADPPAPAPAAAPAP